MVFIIGAISLKLLWWQGQPAWYSHWNLFSLACELVNDYLESLDVFLRLFRAEKSCVILICFIASFRPAIILLEKFHLHDITRDKRCNILFLAKLGPVNACEPGMLLDLTNRLWSAGRIFIQQSG